MIQGYAVDFTDDELADLARGTRVRVPAPFLGGFDVEVRALTEPEIEDARAEARARARFVAAQRGLGRDALRLLEELEERELERAIVARATVQPGARAAVPFFEGVADVEGLDASTVTTLFDAFLDARERTAPLLDTADAKALAKRLAKERDPLVAARAQHASELCAFYGVAAVAEVTDWQVIHFLKLREPQA